MINFINKNEALVIFDMPIFYWMIVIETGQLLIRLRDSVLVIHSEFFDASPLPGQILYHKSKNSIESILAVNKLGVRKFPAFIRESGVFSFDPSKHRKARDINQLKRLIV